IMLPWGKMALLCRMMMFLWACHWCLGGFTPDRGWGQETSAQSSPTTGSSSEETRAQSSPKRGSSSEEHSKWNPVYWKYQPTNDELMKYRKSWNPFSHGPILANSPDVQPKSQWLIQAFVFSEFGDRQFGNKFGTNTSPAPVKLKAIAPTFWVGYGITDNVELDVVPSFIWYDAQTNPAFSASSGSPSGHKVTPN